MTMENRIRVMLADDHQIILDGLSAILSNEADIEVVAKALDGKQVMDRLKAEPIDVLVLDLSMPRMDGLETLRELRERYPAVQTIILSFHDEGERIAACMAAGAKGYILKNRGGLELVTAIRKVAEGNVHFPEDVMNAYLKHLQQPVGGIPKDVDPPSDRERQVMSCILAGMTSKEIGDVLCIAHSTVESHKKNIRERYELPNKSAIAFFAARLGIEPWRK